MNGQTTVEVTRDGAVLDLLLAGTDRLNAIGSTTYGALAAAVADHEQDTRVRAVLIHGAGRGFSAGADIEEISGFSDRAAFASFIEGFTTALDVLTASRLPIVAAVHGFALGGGLELALACDLRVATPRTKLGLPEAKLGVLPGAGGTQRLPRLLPRSVAIEMVMTGEPITGDRAYQLGLVGTLADDEAVLDVASALAHRLADGPPLVPGATKRLMAASAFVELDQGISLEREQASDLFASADGREGFLAFAERRAPSFRGE